MTRTFHRFRRSDNSSLTAFQPLNGIRFIPVERLEYVMMLDFLSMGGGDILKKEIRKTNLFLVGAEGVEPPTLCL